MKTIFILLLLISVNGYSQENLFISRTEKRCDSTTLLKYQFDTILYQNNTYKYHLIGDLKKLNPSYYLDNKPIYSIALISPDFLVGMDSNNINTILKLISERTGFSELIVFRNYCAYEFLYTASKFSEEFEERKEQYLLRNYLGKFDF